MTPTMPRWSLAGLSLVHAAVFAAAAKVLPWPELSPFAVLAGLNALGHVAVGCLALTGSARVARAWRIGSALSLLFLAYVTYAAISSGLYVVNLYAGVGAPLAAAAGAAWCIVAFFTLPIALWGLAKTGGLRGTKRAPLVGALALVGALYAIAARSAVARGETVLAPELTRQSIAASLNDVIVPLLKSAAKKPSLFARGPAICRDSPAAGRITLFATFVRAHAPAAEVVCVDDATLDLALAALAQKISSTYGGGPIAVDVVTKRQSLPEIGPFLGAFAIRPAADGVCLGSKCLLPDQLVGLDEFTRFQSLSAFDVKVGASAKALREALGARGEDRWEGLVRIETASFLLEPDAGVIPLDRLRPPSPSLSRDSLLAATQNAGLFAKSAQEGDGRFHYTTNPFTGDTSMSGFGIPRQAGTTLALCDAGALVPGSRDVAIRSLDMLATLEVRRDDVGGIVFPRDEHKPAWLGSSALTMVALLACRHLVGERYDELIDRLGNGLVASELADGSFAPTLDVKKGDAPRGKFQLYAEGQAVMALVMWEAASGGRIVHPADLGARIDRAMDYASGPYWRTPIRDFFFLEENWHCLAARLALMSHRRDSYERFCIDYMTMKKKLMIEPGETNDPDFVGAYAFGTLVPPHNAATGGFGEALAAVIAIERARGMDTTADEARLREVLAYLLRHQWSDASCVFCTDRVRVVGGFSENIGSPSIRIDFVQHTMSALAHGGRVLGLLDASEIVGDPS